MPEFFRHVVKNPGFLADLRALGWREEITRHTEYKKHEPKMRELKYDFEGDAVLITGATGGIGRELALSLVHDNAHLILHGRDKEKLQGLVKELQGLNFSISIHTVTADLSEKKQVYTLANKVIDHLEEKGINLAVLINNAGMQPIDPQKITDGDINEAFAVNTLAPHILNDKLKEALTAKTTDSRRGRIVQLISSSYINATYDDSYWSNNHPLNSWGMYATSKTANMVLTQKQADSTTDIDFIMVDPGIVPDTDIFPIPKWVNPWFASQIKFGLTKRFINAHQAATAVRYAVINETVENGKMYQFGEVMELKRNSEEVHKMFGDLNVHFPHPTSVIG